MTERIWQYHGTLSEVSPVKISTCYSLIKSRKHAEVHSLVGEGSADTLLLLLLDLLLLMVWTCSSTRCCEDLSARSDGSARDVSSTSPMDRADLKGSSIIWAFVSTRDRRGPTRKVPTICVWFRVWLTERLTWSCPPPRPRDALCSSLPRVHRINNTFNKDNRWPEFLFDIMERALLDTTCRCWLIIHKTHSILNI